MKLTEAKTIVVVLVPTCYDDEIQAYTSVEQYMRDSRIAFQILEIQRPQKRKGRRVAAQDRGVEYRAGYASGYSAGRTSVPQQQLRDSDLLAGYVRGLRAIPLTSSDEGLTRDALLLKYETQLKCKPPNMP